MFIRSVHEVHKMKA